ncbi:MAG: hypothetical protein GF403_09610 [Candidatus Coatesbacteria bacterium]|nr:hypothetical protein [Candidatus Coatesbacteria bacterium]
MEDRYGTQAPGGHCPVHPDRPAVGVCMTCGRLICRDCRRRLAGKNICPRCLAADETSSKRRRRIAGIIALVLTGLAVGLWFSRPAELPPNAERLAEVADAVKTYRSDALHWPGEEDPADAEKPDSASDGGDDTGDQTAIGGEDGDDGSQDQGADESGVVADPFNPVHSSIALRVLLVQPADTRSWFGPYLDDELVVEGLPTDVHDNPIGYYRDERGVMIASAGPDGLYQTALASIQPDEEPDGDDLLAWVRID